MEKVRNFREKGSGRYDQRYREIRQNGKDHLVFDQQRKK